jgi:mRNA interferase MazF
VRGREQAGLRPVLVLSHDLFNSKSGTVIAMAITSQKPAAGFPLTCPLEWEQAGLLKPSWIKISQVRTISVERLGKRIGHTSESVLAQVIEGLLDLIS